RADAEHRTGATRRRRSDTVAFRASHTMWTLPASLRRTPRPHPARRTSLCETLLVADPTPKGAALTDTTQPPTLRPARRPHSRLLTGGRLVWGGAGLIAAWARIRSKLRFTPVPITGQTFSVRLVGASLGAYRGGASALLYVLLGLVFPVYAGGNGGWDVIVGASGGYLLSYPFVAALTGYLAEKRWDRRVSPARRPPAPGAALLSPLAPPRAGGAPKYTPYNALPLVPSPVRPRRPLPRPRPPLGA